MKTYIIDGQISKSHFDEIKFPIVDINKPVRLNPETGEIENVKATEEQVEDAEWDQYLARNDKN